MAVSIEQAIRFLKEKNLLKDWTEPMMRGAIDKAIQTSALAYTEKDGNITGIVFGYWLVPTKSIHIVAAAGELMVFVRYLKQLFPQCELIRAYRRGKLIEYRIGKNL